MLREKKLFLFDIDGTLAVGNTLFDDTTDLLNYISSIGGMSYFITNNSTKSNDDYVEKFKSCFHLETSANQFITSGSMTLNFLKRNYSHSKIFVMGTTSFISELKQNHLHIVQTIEDNIACAVVAYDSELTYAKLTTICELLSTTNIPYYATNPDLCCPMDFGFIPDCGAMCEMITHATGKEPIYLGKPNPEVVEACLEDSGFHKSQTLVIGDRLYTDIACGIKAGVDTCVLFTGEATKKDIGTTPFPPTYYFNTVGDLLNALQ